MTKHKIVSASGAPQEPLPAEVPRDEDHLLHDRHPARVVYPGGKSGAHGADDEGGA